MGHTIAKYINYRFTLIRRPRIIQKDRRYVELLLHSIWSCLYQAILGHKDANPAHADPHTPFHIYLQWQEMQLQDPGRHQQLT